jgi:uncharacterized protein
MTDRVRVLLVVKGHPYQRQPFYDVFDADRGITWTLVEQPAAQALFHPDRAGDFDVFVMYDMPGIEFTGAAPRFASPPASYVAGFEALLDAGKGMVFLHHALCSWPAWDRMAEIVGGRFHYEPATLRGVAYPDSGYRLHEPHHVEVVDAAHPICAGLGDGFDLTDELYLCPVFSDDVVPLMRTTYDVTDASKFYSPAAAIRGRRDTNEGWSHPPGSDLVAWVKHAGSSPVAYLQFGDSPDCYGDPSYRRAVGNAIRWAASPDAHEWARARRVSTGRR